MSTATSTQGDYHDTQGKDPRFTDRGFWMGFCVDQIPETQKNLTKQTQDDLTKFLGFFLPFISASE